MSCATVALLLLIAIGASDAINGIVKWGVIQYICANLAGCHAAMIAVLYHTLVNVKYASSLLVWAPTC